MRNVVVTGGGTVAPIDDVRHIANASTGRFAAAIAEACLARGARVWHVAAPSAARPFDRLARFDLDAPDPEAEAARLLALRRDRQAAKGRLVEVPIGSGTVAEYAEALERTLRSHPIDLAFLAMAVSDFEPEPVAGKIASAADGLVIRCRPTPKVIRRVRDWSPGVYLVGFKLLSGASTDALIRRAGEDGVINRADLTVANNMETVRGGRHAIHLVRPGHPPETFGPGEPLAERLVDRVFAWADDRPGLPPRRA